MITNATLESLATTPRALRIRNFIGRYAVEILLVALIIYICIVRGLTFSVDLYDPASPQPGRQEMSAELSFGTLFTNLSEVATTYFAPDSTATQTTDFERTVAIDAEHEGFNDVAQTDDPAPHISNLTLVLSPDYGERKGLPRHIIAAKKARVRNYLDRYAEAARAEMVEYGIPASITLAQGLLESNAGDSRLARESSNHFGIKCRAKCLGCTCRNYGDDTRYDMFRVFASPAESFREQQ